MLVCRALAHNVIAFNLVEKERQSGNHRTTDAKRRRGGRKKRILESGGSVLV